MKSKPGGKSSSATPKGDKPLTGAARTRALQEELVARTQELAKANERITQLEKTIKDTQQLAALKSPGMAAAQQQAETAKSAPVTPPSPAQTEAPKVDEKAAEGMKAEPMAAPATAPTEQPVAEAKPAPKPKPKPVAPPPPPPEPDLMDMVMDNLPLIGGGLGALVLGGLGIIAARRRRRARLQDDDGLDQIAPTFDAGDSLDTETAAETPAEDAPAATAEEVDPVAEAEVYIAYGRDGQAEEILKEAMSRDPAREDVQVKLAQVYSSRQDAAAFGVVAESLHALTGGAGNNWSKVAALGYALDSANPLYEAGKDIAPARSVENPPTSTDLDFDLGGDGAVAPDFALDAEPAGQATEIGSMQDMAAAADAGKEPEPAMPDFNLDAPADNTEADIAQETATPGEVSSFDFNIELPDADAPTTVKPEPAAAAAATDSGLDFKIDVGDLNIDLNDTSTAAAPPGGEKDNHWYDVQQKFDLAKAYQEMGDNEGAREILQEVITEGDAEQKDQAQKLLGTLG